MIKKFEEKYKKVDKKVDNIIESWGINPSNRLKTAFRELLVMNDKMFNTDELSETIEIDSDYKKYIRLGFLCEN